MPFKAEKYMLHVLSGQILLQNLQANDVWSVHLCKNRIIKLRSCHVVMFNGMCVLYSIVYGSLLPDISAAEALPNLSNLLA